MNAKKREQKREERETKRKNKERRGESDRERPDKAELEWRKGRREWRAWTENGAVVIHQRRGGVPGKDGARENRRTQNWDSR